MAIVEMLKVNLIGLEREKSLILGALSRAKCFELKKSGDYINTVYKNDANPVEKLMALQKRVINVIGIIESGQKKLSKIIYEKKKNGESNIPEFKIDKKPMFFVRKEISYPELMQVAELEYDLWDEIAKIEDLNQKLIELRNNLVKLETKIAAFKPFIDINVPLKLLNKGTKNISFAFGLIDLSKTVDTESLEKEFDNLYLALFRGDTTGMLFAAFEKCEKDTILTRLADLGFVKSSLDCEFTPKEQIEAYQRQMESIIIEEDNLNLRFLEFTKLKGDLEIYYDHLTFEIEKLNASSELAYTKKAFFLEGFIPIYAKNDIEDIIKAATDDVVFEIVTPNEDEVPPTLLKNNAFTKNYESITNMYAVPSYKEKDPNFVLSIFFTIFYGMMLGDAGYGLLLAAATGTIMLFKKLEDSTKRFMFVMFMGGISTIIWGLLFGSVFSIDGIPKVIDPLGNPMLLLGICIALGVMHILAGLGIKAANLIKEKKYIAALAEVVPYYILFIGVGFLAVAMIVGISALNTVALVMVLTGLGTLMIGAGYSKKGIIKKIGAGFGGLYGLINYISDILSYSRLFCLGVAGGAIGMVTNQIGSIFINLLGPIAGIIPAIIMLLMFHGFNLAMGALSAYVHNMRLQYIEFFGKFYEGNGRLFSPMGTRSKFITLNGNKKSLITEK